MKRERDAEFWLRWVLANALAEGVGLSAVLIVGFGLLGPRLAGLSGVWPALLGLLGGVLLGLFEGFVVGALQGVVLRGRLPALSLRAWIIATILGAMVAWGLGMLPSTLISAGADASQAAAEPPAWFVYVMAAGLGLVAGVVLAWPQWRVLKLYRLEVTRSGLWLPANALAWLFGMPLVFLGMDAIPPGAGVLQAIPIVVAATALAGAVVGAIHGLILVRVLLR